MPCNAICLTSWLCAPSPYRRRRRHAVAPRSYSCESFPLHQKYLDLKSAGREDRMTLQGVFASIRSRYFPNSCTWLYRCYGSYLLRYLLGLILTCTGHYNRCVACSRNNDRAHQGVLLNFYSSCRHFVFKL